MDGRRPLEAALDAALAAGEILRRDFHRTGGARGGGDKAEADVEAERLIRARLREAFPGWGYLGEETGRAPGEAGRPIWLVDPNDGTRDYLAGRRGSAVAIGLLADRRPVLGVVFAFAYPDDDGDLFTWAEGCGPVRRNGRAAPARLPDALGAQDVVLVSSKGDRDPETNLRCVAPARYRTVPSIAHRLALVAAGEAAAAASLFAPRAWDYAAGDALLRGAGAVIVDEEGREVAYADDGTSQTLRAFAGSKTAVGELVPRPWAEVSSGPWRGERPASLKPGCAVEDAGLLSRAQGASSGRSRATTWARSSSSARRPRSPRAIPTDRACSRMAGIGASWPASPPTIRRWPLRWPAPSAATGAPTAARCPKRIAVRTG